PEYSHHEQEIDVPPGADITVAAKLERVVDTAGWMSTDFHNHSSPSGDNTCGTDDRVINLAAEHIEFAPTTEHNRLYDWRPHIEKLGLTAEIATVSGMELTGGGAHFNCFPLKPEPTKQDGGAPVWQKDPRLNAVVLRDYQGEEPDRWVQINHPDITENFFDKNRDGRLDGGYMALGSLIDGFETQNFIGDEILWGAPYRLRKPLEKGSRVEHVREFQWLQLLNQGQRIWGTAVADAHSVYGNGVGGWRTYVKSATDEPFEVDWRDIARNAKAGRMMLTTGPFLTVETGGGVLPGGEDRATGAARLKVKVQCNTWNAIDRVQVLVNGRQREDVNFTRAANPAMFQDGVVQFDQTIEVPLSQDAHLIVVAIGENHTIEKGFGTSTQASMMPCAYHNPIFIDVDGGGFQANHDTLDHPLPVHGLTVDQVKAILGDKVGR
ncbi:MAG: CehA/McbA family metallohydrolase, partial [Verrucomicrobiales bacterium]